MLCLSFNENTRYIVEQKYHIGLENFRDVKKLHFFVCMILRVNVGNHLINIDEGKARIYLNCVLKHMFYCYFVDKARVNNNV